MNLNSLNKNSVSKIISECMGGDRVSNDLKLLVEGYGRRWKGTYDHPKVEKGKWVKDAWGARKWDNSKVGDERIKKSSGLYGGKHQGDPKPDILVFGRYSSKQKDDVGKRKVLAFGLNLNYIEEKYMQALQKALPKILKVGKRDRYKVAMRAMGKLLGQEGVDVVKKSYRTYEISRIHGITKDTLKFWIDEKKKEKKNKKDAQAPRAQGQSDVSTQDEIIDTAIDTARTDVATPEVALKTPKKVAKRKKKVAPEIEAPEVEPAPEAEPAPDIQQTQEQDAAAQAQKVAEKLDPLEDEFGESRLGGLNAVIEAYALAAVPKIKWKSKRDYIKWHNLDAFFKTHPDTNRPVIESAKGSRFMALYDIIDDKLVVDITNSCPEMMCETGWDYNHTLCMSIENGELDVFYEHPRGSKALKTLMDGDFGRFINYLT